MRSALKRQLTKLGHGRAPSGATLLIYHRVGGGSPDELDTPTAAFAAQLDALADHEVVTLDDALDRLEAGDPRPTVVLTFDDGFADVHSHAWPLLRQRSLPFTLYLTAGLVGAPEMRWEGATAQGVGAALSWDHLAELSGSGMCTIGNHTWSHARPDAVDSRELDRCSDQIEAHLGYRPRHFAFTWGVEVPSLRPALQQRFRSAATGRLGRNRPGDDLLALKRVPVRQSDPIEFFQAKLHGDLRAEQTYELIVRAAKRLGVHSRAEPITR